MLAVLSILISVSLSGILFCLIRLLKFKKDKEINFVETIKVKKGRKILIYVLITCSIFFVLAISLIFSLYFIS